MTRARHIEFVLDFVCVHSYRTFTRLRRVVQEHRVAGTLVEIDFLPYQLAPEAPTGTEPLFEVHRRDRGEQAAREIAADTTLGAEDGLDIDLSRALFTNTFPAHRLLLAAGDHRLAEPAAQRLFRAYFTEGRHLGDRDTLAALARDTEMPPVADVDGEDADARLREALARVRERGAISAPELWFDDGTVLAGEPTAPALREVLAQ